MNKLIQHHWYTDNLKQENAFSKPTCDPVWDAFINWNKINKTISMIKIKYFEVINTMKGKKGKFLLMITKTDKSTVVIYRTESRDYSD